MVIQCVVFKCSNRQGSKAKEKDASFFRFTKDRKKRLAWIRAINRDDWTPNEYSRVCFEHFVDSRHSDDPTDINYRPTLFAYKSQQPSESQTARNERLSKRNSLQVISKKEANTKLNFCDKLTYIHMYWDNPDLSKVSCLLSLLKVNR